MYLERQHRWPTAFNHWISDRLVPSLSTNAGAPLIAFQEWRKFKEAFAPEIIGQALSETEIARGGQVSHIVDPFGGSGTTALASQFLGRRSTTIEVNPYLADLIEAKLAAYDYDALSAAYVDVCRSLCEGIKGPYNLSNAPRTFVEPGVKGKFLFSTASAQALVDLLNTIDCVTSDPVISRLFKVLAVSISVSVSNAVVSGKGRRYRANWERRVVTRDQVIEAFKSLAKLALYDIRRFSNRGKEPSTLLRGDCRDLIGSVEEHDLSVFSPPYPNSFDYTDVYNIELWIGGYLDSSDANLTLRKRTLRSHVQIKRDYQYGDLSSPTLMEALDRLNGVRERLWSNDIPNMVGAYFADMVKVMSGLTNSLTKNGRMYMIVGDSSYANVPVPVATILAELAEPLSLRLVRMEPFRSMRASPQQGGRAELPETLVVLTR